jgi:DNA-binding MarR family transcriptional regulator
LQAHRAHDSARAQASDHSRLTGNVTRRKRRAPKALRARDRSLTPLQSHVLRVLQSKRARAHRAHLEIPMEEIARLAGCSLRTLQRAVRVLVARGLLVRTYLPGPRDRFDRKRSQWLVPYEPTERGPVACAVSGRMHGPWPPGEAPVWSRYAPKRVRPEQRFETRHKPSEPQRVAPSLPSDKSAPPSFPTGTGGGDPPSPPPEPEENASAVRTAVAASLKCEAGGGPPASPPVLCEPSGRASAAIQRPTPSTSYRAGGAPPEPLQASREASADRSPPPAFERARAAAAAREQQRREDEREGRRLRAELERIEKLDAKRRALETKLSAFTFTKPKG